jgi:hypothetical protein
VHKYAGTYSHPGYQTIDLVVKGGTLHTSVLDRTWAFTLDLEHVSGEHFICHFVTLHLGSKEAIKAEFSKGANRKAEKLRLDFEEGVKKIEFSRIET